MGAILWADQLTFFGDKFHGDGFHIGPDGFEGWNDGVDVRRERIPRATSDGEFDVPTFLNARHVSVEGFVVAESFRVLHYRKAQFLGLYGRPVRITVEEGGVTLWASAKVDARPGFDASGFFPDATYSIEFVCADPRKYGETHTGGPASSVSAYHYGNFPASSVIEVTGTMPSGYTINGPDGRQYVVSQALSAGQTHRIEMRTGRLFRNGVRQLGAVSKAQTWQVPPGQSVLHVLSPASGSGQMTVAVTDTYI